MIQSARHMVVLERVAARSSHTSLARVGAVGEEAALWGLSSAPLLMGIVGLGGYLLWKGGAFAGAGTGILIWGGIAVAVYFIMSPKRSA